MQAILMEFIDLYKTSFIIIIAIVAFTIQIVVFNDPPSFPLPDDYENSIDCFNIVSSTIKIDKSRIKVTMNVKDFIQYPIEVASSMVHIESKSGYVNFSFSSEQFWDLISDRHHISFCVLQTAAGDIEASLYCQKNLLAKTRNKIKSIDAYPVGWSRLFEDDYFTNTYTDVCINSKLKLVFCSKQSAKIRNIRLSWSEEMPIIITSRSEEKYQQSEKIPTLDNFSIFVPRNYPTKKSNISKPQDFMIDTILPIVGSLNFSANSYIVPDNNTFEQLKPILGAKQKILSKGCYKKLSFLPSTGSSNILSKQKYQSYAQAESIHINFLFSFSKEKFQQIKKFYKSESKKYDIVLDQEASQFSNTLKKLSSNIFVINDNHNFSFVAKILSNAKILVASNVKTLFFGSLMNEKSTIIEIVPDGMNCLNFEKNLSIKFDTNYRVLKNKDKKCVCKDFKNFECYFKYEHKYNHVDEQDLFDLVKSSLK